MINQDCVLNLKSIITHLRSTDGYQHFVRYFEEKQKEVMINLLAQSGVLTPEELIEGNARLKIYEELANFENTLQRDIIKPNR